MSLSAVGIGRGPGMARESTLTKGDLQNCLNLTRYAQHCDRRWPGAGPFSATPPPRRARRGPTVPVMTGVNGVTSRVGCAKVWLAQSLVGMTLRITVDSQHAMVDLVSDGFGAESSIYGVDEPWR